MESSGNAVVDFGRFCTGFLCLMGVGRSYVSFYFNMQGNVLARRDDEGFRWPDDDGKAGIEQEEESWRLKGPCYWKGHMLTMDKTALPVLLAHSGIILWYAAVMSIIGGVLIYGTIIAFGMFFEEESEF